MKTGVYVAIIITFIALIYIFAVAPYPEMLPKWVVDTNQACLIGCNSEMCRPFLCGRGNKYIIEETSPEIEEKARNCMLTTWNFSHFIFYTVIAFLCPEYPLELFMIGNIFEYYEYLAYECQDTTDILANTMGIATGVSLAKIINI